MTDDIKQAVPILRAPLGTSHGLARLLTHTPIEHVHTKHMHSRRHTRAHAEQLKYTKDDLYPKKQKIVGVTSKLSGFKTNKEHTVIVTLCQNVRNFSHT